MSDQQEVPASSVFIPSSINDNFDALVDGRSYIHYSLIPERILNPSDNSEGVEKKPECVLGVDEAGRGPVIGPMVYGIFYLPIEIQHSLLATKYQFDDSKVLTPAVRANLMKAVCTQGTDLNESCGWAIKSISAQDIGAGMLKYGGAYNLNAQAMDATIEVIRGVIDRGVNVREIYIDTIGVPAVYQKKLERIFPTIKIVVAKKADSLYPCVSAASVVAKVTRDVSCEMLHVEYLKQHNVTADESLGWGSGYPSDARCVNWMKGSMDPLFGWGNECRFSWGTVKDMLETKASNTPHIDWVNDAEEDVVQLSQFFRNGSDTNANMGNDELGNWFGMAAGQEVF